MTSSAYMKEYKAKNKERIKELAAQYRIKNRERLRAYYRDYARKYRQNNKDKINKNNRNYRKTHLEAVRQKARAYYHVYKNINPDKLKSWRASPETLKQKYKNNTHYRLKILCSTRIRKALKGIGVQKAAKTVELIGCSIPQLKEHLEHTFTEGMSWDVFHLLHIDHIKPCCSFDLSHPDEQRKCFHYTNLRMLWASDNWVKVRKDKKLSIHSKILPW